VYDSSRVGRSCRYRVLGREFEAPQACLLRRDIAGETEHIARRTAQHVGGVLTLTAPMIDLRSKRIGCDRRPDRFCSSLNQLRACHLDLHSPLRELMRDSVNICHRPTVRHVAPARAGPTNLRAASPVRRHNATRGANADRVVEKPTQTQACARAAAFISFLCARTVCNDSGLVTSATER
jgi:hypothetical protein